MIKKYCDICGEELNYESWLAKFYVESDVEKLDTLIQLCDRHKKEIYKFIKLLKHTSKGFKNEN